MTADVWKSQEVPIGSMDHRSIGLREGRDLRICHQVPCGAARCLEQPDHLFGVITYGWT
jgi:hypothetical protein